MATTVTPTILSVSITESYILNGVEYGGTKTKTYTSSGKVFQRIMVAKTDDPAIINFGSNDELGQVIAADFQYFRVTNLDDTNFITLTLFNGTDSFFYKLKAGDTLLLMDNEMDAIASSSTFGAFADITQIKADANTAECAIEFFAVTT
jgi:hypothetical protein